MVRGRSGGVVPWLLLAVLVVGALACHQGSEDPLMQAAEADDRAAAQRLLAAGEDVNTDFAGRDHDDKGGWWYDGSTPLMEAACKGHDKMVDLLITKGARVDQTATVNLRTIQWGKPLHQLRKGWTPLLCAAARGQYYAVKALIDHHAGVNVQADDGFTPLHYAVAVDKTGIVKALLAAKANVDAADKTGQTPLHLAAKRGYVDVVPLLAAANANVNARNGKGQTPLDVASSEDMRDALRKVGGKRADDPPAP